MNSENKRKGLLVDVFKNPLGDCTNKGVSHFFSKLLLVGEGVDGPFEESANYPTVELIPAKQGGKRMHVKPLGETGWVMFGGNFVYSSDSRFAKLNGGNPIAIFDRIER